jgi:hypothetical protein
MSSDSTDFIYPEPKSIFVRLPTPDQKLMRAALEANRPMIVDVNNLNAINVKNLKAVSGMVVDTNIVPTQKEYLKTNQRKLSECFQDPFDKLSGWRWYIEHLLHMIEALPEVWLIGLNHGAVKDRIAVLKKLQKPNVRIVASFNTLFDSLADFKKLHDTFGNVAIENLDALPPKTQRVLLMYVSGMRGIWLNNAFPSALVASFNVDVICTPQKAKYQHQIYAGTHRIGWTEPEHSRLLNETDAIGQTFMMNQLGNFEHVEKAWRAMPTCNWGL